MTDPRVTERKFVRYREYMGEEGSLNCYAVADDGTAWTSFWRGKEMQPWQQVLALPPADDPPPRDHRDAPGVSEPAETKCAYVNTNGVPHCRTGTAGGFGPQECVCDEMTENSPSPTSPGPASANAEPVARAGEWWLVVGKDGHSDLVLETASKAEDARVYKDRGWVAWAPWHVVHVVPASRLADAERERDVARRTSQYWKDEHHAANTLIDQLRADLARANEERDAKDRQLTTCYAELDDTMKHLTALRERVETGKRCWMENGQWFWGREPTAAERSRFGPFTPGRFVKDEET